MPARWVMPNAAEVVAEAGYWMPLGMGIGFAVVVLLAFSFLPIGVLNFLMLEKQQGVKNQLLISGCRYSAYWLSNLIWDVGFALAPVAVCVRECLMVPSPIAFVPATLPRLLLPGPPPRLVMRS